MDQVFPTKITEAELLQKFDTFVFDADGVLWKGDQPITGAADFVNSILDDPSKKLFIVTNNSTKTVDLYMDKIKRMGIKGLQQEQLLCPSIVMADYFNTNSNKFENADVYLIGVENLKNTLESLSTVKCHGIGKDIKDDYEQTGDFIFDFARNIKPKAVIVSFDAHFSYPKLLKAVNYLSDPDCEFLVSNEDNIFPGPVPHVILPETAPWVASITSVTGRVPDTVFGKPCSAMCEYLKKKAGGIDPSRTVMFGDRLESDIMFGKRNGFSTVWVPTGVSTIADIELARMNQDVEKIPDYTTRFGTK